MSRLEEGNQRKETWTSHNTSSWPIQNYRQLSGPVFVYNDPTKLVTRPQAQTWWQNIVRTEWDMTMTMSTIKELRPCKMTVYNPNLSRSPITGSSGNSETVMAGHLNQEPWEQSHNSKNEAYSWSNYGPKQVCFVNDIPYLCELFEIWLLTMCLSQKECWPVLN